MIDSAPMATARFTFSTSVSRSMQSLEVPRFTLIFVFSMEPMPLGSRALWTRLQGMAARPSATH